MLASLAAMTLMGAGGGFFAPVAITLGLCSAGFAKGAIEHIMKSFSDKNLSGRKRKELLEQSRILAEKAYKEKFDLVKDVLGQEQYQLMLDNCAFKKDNFYLLDDETKEKLVTRELKEYSERHNMRILYGHD